jgi:hypothetical protein
MRPNKTAKGEVPSMARRRRTGGGGEARPYDEEEATWLTMRERWG